MPGASPAIEPSPPLVKPHQIDGSIFQPYDNAWSITMRGPDGTISDAGMSSDHVRFIQIDGKAYLTRLETTASATVHTLEAAEAGVSTTFNVSDPKSLRPILGEERSSDGDRKRQTFFAGRVLINTTSGSGGTERTQEVTLPRAVYDLRGGMAGLLLAALPLRKGFTTTFPNLDGGKYDERVVEVVGHEWIAAGHLGRRKAWVVDIGRLGRVRYWVIKTAPYVLKVRISSEEGETIWDTI